jgi:hypothetical protein
MILIWTLCWIHPDLGTVYILIFSSMQTLSIVIPRVLIGPLHSTWRVTGVPPGLVDQISLGPCIERKRKATL